MKQLVPTVRHSLYSFPRDYQTPKSIRCSGCDSVDLIEVVFGFTTLSLAWRDLVEAFGMKLALQGCEREVAAGLVVKL